MVLTAPSPAAAASANVLVNGDFSSGITGWTPFCFSWGGAVVSGGCSNDWSVNAAGIEFTGALPYSGATQAVAAGADSVLTGVVTVKAMANCYTDGAVIVSVNLEDANHSGLGSVEFTHHPYVYGCTDYIPANTATVYYQDMPAWTAGSGPHGFTMDIGSIVSQHLSGVDPAKVAYIQVYLEDYADMTQPDVVFGRLALATTGAVADTTAPVTTAAASPAPNAAGWNNSAVTVSLAATDAESGGTGVKGITYSASGAQTIGSTTVSGGTATVQLTADGTTTLTYAATDNAGNVEAPHTLAVAIDRTAPLAPTLSFAPNGSNGWFVTSPATGMVAASDATSGVASISCTDNGNALSVGAGGALSVTGDGTHAISCTATDKAGNTSAAGTATVRIDTTPPAVTASAAPAANGYGWNDSAVTVAASGTDATSGIDPASCTQQTLSGEGAGQSATVGCRDYAGNSATATVSGINIDLAAPTITGSRSPGANSYGWNNGPVTARFVCGDGLSGVASCSGATTLSAEGQGQSVTGTATDKAGNAASATVGDVNIDLTAPTVSVSAPSTVLQNTAATATVAAADALSGVAQVTAVIDSERPLVFDAPQNSISVPLDTTTVGSHHLTVTVTDEAGNTTTSATMTYAVWGVVGPSAPLNVQGHAAGLFKAGSTLPVKFQLTDGTSLVTTATGTVTIGSASAAFAWDPTDQQYQADVHTAKSASGTYAVVLDVTGVGEVQIASVELH